MSLAKCEEKFDMPSVIIRSRENKLFRKHTAQCNISRMVERFRYGAMGNS